MSINQVIRITKTEAARIGTIQQNTQILYITRNPEREVVPYNYTCTKMTKLKDFIGWDSRIIAGWPSVCHRLYNKTSSSSWNIEARNRISTGSQHPWLESFLHSKDTPPAPAVFRLLSRLGRTRTPNTCRWSLFFPSLWGYWYCFAQKCRKTGIYEKKFVRLVMGFLGKRVRRKKKVVGSRREIL